MRTLNELESYNEATLKLLQAIVSCREAIDDAALSECNNAWRARLVEAADDGDASASTESLLSRIEYGRCDGWIEGEATYGFRIVGTNILISDALHVIENDMESRLFPDASERYPQMTHEGWAALIRFTIDVMSVLDREVSVEEPNP